MKFSIAGKRRGKEGPTPHGVGGLKSLEGVEEIPGLLVPPRTGWVD